MLRDELTQDGSWAPERPTKRLGAWSKPNLEGWKGRDLIWVQADDQWLNQSSLPYWKEKGSGFNCSGPEFIPSQGTKILQAACTTSSPQTTPSPCFTFLHGAPSVLQLLVNSSSPHKDLWDEKGFAVLPAHGRPLADTEWMNDFPGGTTFLHRGRGIHHWKD